MLRLLLLVAAMSSAEGKSVQQTSFLHLCPSTDIINPRARLWDDLSKHYNPNMIPRPNQSVPLIVNFQIVLNRVANLVSII
jgi:hypothetical protein